MLQATEQPTSTLAPHFIDASLFHSEKQLSDFDYNHPELNKIK